MLHSNKSTEDSFYLLGLAVAALAAAGGLLNQLFGPFHFMMPPCPFHFITGFYCPGCGGTRAVRALLRGDLVRALYYHPLVPYGAVIYLWFMASQTIDRLSGHRIPIGMRYRNGYAWTAVAITLLQCAGKNILFI